MVEKSYFSDIRWRNIKEWTRISEETIHSNKYIEWTRERENNENVRNWSVEELLTQLVGSIELSRCARFVFMYKYMYERHNWSNMIYECHYDKRYHHSIFTMQKDLISMKAKRMRWTKETDKKEWMSESKTAVYKGHSIQ